MIKEEICIFWFRRDLRFDDNAGLYHALTSGYKVLPVFIFDKNILNQVEKPINLQVEFIHHQIHFLQQKLYTINKSLLVEFITPIEFFTNILNKYVVKAIYANEDYEYSSRQRDEVIGGLLNSRNVSFYLFKDQVIFSKDEVVKKDGNPYTVFTPYSKRWKELLSDSTIKSFDCSKYLINLFQTDPKPIPTLQELGFTTTHKIFPSTIIDKNLLIEYSDNRDYMALDATSHLGVHLRFGTISIRKLISQVRHISDAFLNELIWREFYQAITWHYPHICTGKPFKLKYDNISWRNNEKEFEEWCQGKTGFPIVDAGMRQLNATGFMHNRSRMITASFLTKHLLIDWRWGEAYFASKLLDFDFAANNGGWQWAAGSGCDSSPYFRIFNPTLQSSRFDKNSEYIKKWIPEINTLQYMKPIVEHHFARNRALKAYAAGLYL